MSDMRTVLLDTIAAASHDYGELGQCIRVDMMLDILDRYEIRAEPQGIIQMNRVRRVQQILRESPAETAEKILVELYELLHP